MLGKSMCVVTKVHCEYGGPPFMVGAISALSERRGHKATVSEGIIPTVHRIFRDNRLFAWSFKGKGKRRGYKTILQLSFYLFAGFSRYSFADFCG